MTTPNNLDPNLTMPPLPTGIETAAFDSNQTTDPTPAVEDNRTGAYLPSGGPNETTDDLNPHGRDTVAPATRKRKSKELPTVPGYEITGVLGRGGMGIVYRAQQTRLNRAVALKMVLAGAHASPDQLARFDQEARAVARLQHPNIVQIYEIGELEGLPYFSLEFVEGGTLEKLIDRKPRPPAEAAALVEVLARAMYFAHQQHIIHRDLKPGNILLAGRPAAETQSGTTQTANPDRTTMAPSAPATLFPKITDFGLAKTIEEGGTAQTASGAIMGTPTYMAPEQARGDLPAVGPHSDLYSLGAILYELLTGRPPFQGASLLETLSQVQKSEPVPPKQLQPGMPVDLDTICLKCLQKEPAKRYASCEALADDLRRFLNGDPIQARPVTSAERLWRWCRRNPGIASLSAALALMLICMTGVSTWAAITFANQNTVIKEEKERVEDLFGKEKLAREKEQEAREKAVAEEKLATGQARVALEALQTVLTTVQNRLRNEPQTQELKAELLRTVLDHIDRIDPRAEGLTNIGPTRISAHMQVGHIYRERGESNNALAEFRKVYELAKARVPMFQNSDASRRNLAASLYMLAQMHQELNRDMRAALTHYQQALKLWEEIDGEPRADTKGQGKADKLLVKIGLADMNSVVGATRLRLGEPAEAMSHFQKNLALRREIVPEAQRIEAVKKPAIKSPLDANLDLARALLAVGDTSFRLKESTTADASFSECLKIIEEQATRYPKQLAIKQEWGRACGLAGDFYLRSGNLARVRPLYESAQSRAQELVKLDPKQVLFQWDLGHAEYRLGLLAQRSKNANVAATHFANCLTIREKLAAQDKSNDRRQMEYMLALARCGRADEADWIAQRLLRGKPDAELFVDVARCYSQCASQAEDAATQTRRISARVADLWMAGTQANAVMASRLSFGVSRLSKRDDPRANRQAAIELLHKALNLGYRDEVYLGTEVDLDPLRSDSAFDKVLEAARTSEKGAERKR